MFSLSSLNVTKVSPQKDGFFVSARYANWCSEYSFFIAKNGEVKGRASSGEWLELGEQNSSCIQAKLQQVLSEEPTHIFA